MHTLNELRTKLNDLSVGEQFRILESTVAEIVAFEQSYREPVGYSVREWFAGWCKRNSIQCHNEPASDYLVFEKVSS